MDTATKKAALALLDEARSIVIDLDAAGFEDAIGKPLADFARDCHAAAIAVVRSGVLGRPCRVARGFCRGVGGQHSWVVVGMDCYRPDAVVVDPTLWSYDSSVGDGSPAAWVGRAHTRPHLPHGSMESIWTWGRPAVPTGPVIDLDRSGLSPAAVAFLDLLGPLDRQGWGMLAHAPLGMWPAAEILGAMWDHPKLSALVPIDIVGMVTDRNPCGLYLAA